MVVINFSFQTEHGQYSDALHLPDDHGYSDAEIEAMKQQRFDAWKNIVRGTDVPDTTDEA